MDVNVMYSLKNLTKLVEIVIESNRNYSEAYQQQVTDRMKEWPALPKLKCLHLSGYCFSQISVVSPNEFQFYFHSKKEFFIQLI